MVTSLFSYGTLMPYDLESAAREGWVPDAVRGNLFDLGPYPALVNLDDRDAGWVEGYVIGGMTPELIRLVDGYEETDRGLYKRLVTITRNDRQVWVYVYSRSLPDHARGPMNRWEGSLRVQLSSLLVSRQGAPIDVE